MPLKKLTMRDLKREIKFLKDDKVVLRSGGPVMMVEKYVWDELSEGNNSDRVICIWFDKNKLHKETFNIGSLNHYEDNISLNSLSMSF